MYLKQHLNSLVYMLNVTIKYSSIVHCVVHELPFGIRSYRQYTYELAQLWIWRSLTCGP